MILDLDLASYLADSRHSFELHHALVGTWLDLDLYIDLHGTWNRHGSILSQSAPLCPRRP